jgi:tetratricopeptide (TPR) repeat protein
MWGRRSSLAMVGALLAVLVGCQAGPPRVAIDPAELRYAAAEDSLGIVAFEQLPANLRRARTGEARRWLRRADGAGTLATELRALRTVVGLDPTQAVAWLRLARLCRWYGDYQQTEDALAGVAAAYPRAPRGRRVIAGQAALTASWLRYDRGEWRRGLAWADSAAAHGAPDEDVQLLMALHQAGLGRNRRAEEVAHRFAQRDHRTHWIYGISFWRRGGGVEAARAVFTGRATGINIELVQGPMLPREPRAAECFRDHARVEELVGNWWEAERLYTSSMKFVPGRKRAELVRVSHPPLGGAGRSEMPIWLAFDRYYVTGSLSAYTDLAFQRYRAAAEPDDREFWATAVLDAAGSCVRLGLDAPQARRARGLVMADVPQQWRQARVDLEAALRASDRANVTDVEVLAILGRLYLREDQPTRARPLLERVVGAAPGQASAWADLGLARAQVGKPELALAALERALELDPELAAAWYNRGLLRYHLDDLDGAVADLERAHVLAPGDPEVATLLGELRRQLERRAGEGS